MSWNAVRKNLSLAGIASTVMLIVASSSAEAQSNNNRSFTMAGRQMLLIEKMTNSALLAALEIDASPSLRSIHWSRDRFDRIQTELRQGNPNTGLPSTTEPKILETLDRADSRWRLYDSIFQEVVASKGISKAQISALTRSHGDLTEALSQMIGSYQYFVYGGDDHSILSSTINGAGRLRASTQLVLRGLMMAAYNGYAKEQRELLAEFTKEFDETIDGLIRGNPERRLLPAANQEIKEELMKVDRMWKEARPILKAAADGEAVTKDQIAAVAKSANDMAVPLTLTLIMYLTI